MNVEGPQHELDDAALFRGIVERDPELWAACVDRFGPQVQAIARRSGLHEAEVDEVLQVTWMTLLRHAGSIREPRSLAAWIARTAARESWRQSQRSRRAAGAGALSSDELGEAGEPAAPDALDLESLERAQTVRDAVAKLPGPCRGLLVALFLEPGEPAYAEVAARLGMPVGSIGPTRARCLARLEAIVMREGLGNEDL